MEYSVNLPSIKTLQPPPDKDQEREACSSINPNGFYIRHPPAPHTFKTFLTPDDTLFQTIHMGAAVINEDKWRLVIDGLVKIPYALNLVQLRTLFPKTTITAFHECYGSPLKPPIENVWRIGNVEWTGVRVKDLLSLAIPLPNAQFVWSEGLDHGEFGGISADRYQKDLPLTKARSPEVLVAYEINGKPLDKERGGPVRLIVPGWFGTNMTKWLCKLSVQSRRAPGPYTTTFYNERDLEGGLRPVWEVEPNSLIIEPAPGTVICGSQVFVKGWAWSHDGIRSVAVSVDEGKSWVQARTAPRIDFSWQSFEVTMNLPQDICLSCTIIARATSISGMLQPLTLRRNHAPRVSIKLST